VQPQSEEEIEAVAAAAARRRIPVTVRGGGTGNYGQSVPLKGGIVLDMTRYDKVIAVEAGSIRVQAGALIASALAAALATGQQLMMYPSTHEGRHAWWISRRRLCRHRLGSSRHHSRFRHDSIAQDHDA
jgi:FAD/FMN-containing dehydrogenase